MSETIISALLLGTGKLQPITIGSATQNSAQVPQDIAQLPVGSILKGFVINRDQQGNPVLRTDRGDVAIRSDLFLKTGSEVVIRINQQGNQTQARIVSVDQIPVKEVQEQQQQQALPKNDQILQSSMMKSATSAEMKVTQAMNEQSIMLNAILLKPSSTNAQSSAMMSSIFKLPPSVIIAIEQGLPLQFKVVSNDMSALPLTQNQPASSTPPPAGTTVNPVTLSQYQAYAQLGATATVGGSAANPAATAAAPTTLPAATPIPVPVTPTTSGVQPPAMPTTLPSTTGSPVAGTPIAGAAPLPTGSPIPAASAPLMPQPLNPNAPAALTAQPAMSATATTAALPASTLPAGTPAALELAQALAPATAYANPNAGIPLPASATAVTTAAAPANTSVEIKPANLQGGIITAKVIGSEAGGETIVRTSVGTFKIFTAAPPPVGSNLQLQLVNTPALMQAASALPSPVTASGSSMMATLSALSHDWAQLDETLHALRPDAAQLAALTQRIPNTKSKLVNSVLFFLSAMKSGDLSDWLGKRLHTQLNEQHSQLLQRLGADFTGIRTVATEQPDQPWQMLLFPLMHDDELAQARLFIRRDDEEGKSGGQNGQRFVLEVTMSEMGDLQLDGFVRKQDSKTLFDLVVRSISDLPDEMQRDIEAIFHSGAEATGYKGSIRFQPDPQRFVFPLELNMQSGSNDDYSIIA